jgi:hypothetical protein
VFSVWSIGKDGSCKSAFIALRFLDAPSTGVNGATRVLSRMGPYSWQGSGGDDRYEENQIKHTYSSNGA